MTILAQLHDCHSCYDERSIDQKKSTQVDAHPEGGGSWVSSTLPMQDITLLRFMDPHFFGVPDPNTLVGSRLHQLRLMHPT